jgi:hypothetical protein
MPQVNQRQRFAQCRSLGHEWKHAGRVSDDDPDGSRLLGRPSTFGMIGFRSICSWCGAERIKWVTRSGHLDKSCEYRYPDGYQTHGDDRQSLSEWRQEFIVHSLDEMLEVS